MGKTLYLMSSGELGRKDNTVYVAGENGKKYIPVETTDEILIFGEVSLNKKFLEFASQMQLILHFFNHYGYYSGTYYPREHLNSGAVILAQAKSYLDQAERLKIARLFVSGAISNMEKVVSYYSRRGLENLEKTSTGLAVFRDQLDSYDDISALMGIEGNARDLYYSVFDEVVDDEDFYMGKRTRRPPTNFMNALISFLNTMCYILALSQIYRTHLDPRIGFLHETNFRRFSLNLDLAEIFKPILVDRVIFSLVNKKEIQKKHFSKKGDGIFLNERGREIVLRAWEERIQGTIDHPRLKRKVSYRGLVRMDAYKLEKHIIGDSPYEPFVSRW